MQASLASGIELYVLSISNGEQAVSSAGLIGEEVSSSASILITSPVLINTVTHNREPIRLLVKQRDSTAPRVNTVSSSTVLRRGAYCKARGTHIVYTHMHARIPYQACDRTVSQNYK